MEFHKKSMFFTAISIALSMVVILSYRVYTGYSSENQLSSDEIRIGALNNFVLNLEKDIENAIYIVGFRSLMSIEDFLIENNDLASPPKFLNDLGTNINKTFDEVFRVGTINTQVMANMAGNTFQDWINKMETEADKRDIQLDLTILPNDVVITQTNPYKVDIFVHLNIDLKEPNNIASWQIDKVYSRQLNITGFYDPLYIVNTDGLVKNEIIKTPVNFTLSSANLNTHLINSWYYEHNDSPSYLMRFENNLNSSPFGTESLVNSQKLIDKGLTPLTRSAVDFIYFGDKATVNCHVNGIPYNWFYLDKEPIPSHLIFYKASCDSGEETECPLYDNAENYDYIFKIQEWLRADLTEEDATSDAIPVVIPAGEHDITLVSYDNHPDDDEPNERWYLKLFDTPGHLELSTNHIDDLPATKDWKTQKVDEERKINHAIHYIVAVHKEYHDSTPHRIKAVCAGFKKRND